MTDTHQLTSDPSEDGATDGATRPKITWFEARDGVELYESGIMSPATMNPDILQEVDLSSMSGGARSTVLLNDPATGFSLVHVWFGEQFPLPRHTHSADCVYYVLKGELRMGSKTVRAGDGMVVPAGRPYTYRAGPGGVEVLEFRASTSFDMVTLDQDVPKWQAFIATAEKMSEAWAQTRPADD